MAVKESEKYRELYKTLPAICAWCRSELTIDPRPKHGGARRAEDKFCNSQCKTKFHLLPKSRQLLAETEVSFGHRAARLAAGDLEFASVAPDQWQADLSALKRRIRAKVAKVSATYE